MGLGCGLELGPGWDRGLGAGIEGCGCVRSGSETARRQLDHRGGQHQRQLCRRRALQHVLVRVCALCRTRAHRARTRRARTRRVRRACPCLGAVTTSLPTGGRWLGRVLVQRARLPLECLEHAERVEVQVVELRLGRLRAREAAAQLRCTRAHLRGRIARPPPSTLAQGVGWSRRLGRRIDRELRAYLPP